MANYAVKLQRTASTTASLGVLSANAATPRRVKVYDVMMGSEATAADNPFLWLFQRTTAAGTSTAITPLAIDPADAAALFTAGQAHTVEPTYTANAILLDIALNQRATFRWVASPGGELVIPATASNGIGIQTPTATAVSITATVHAQEQ
jgi:hypothetical protein